MKALFFKHPPAFRNGLCRRAVLIIKMPFPRGRRFFPSRP